MMLKQLYLFPEIKRPYLCTPNEFYLKMNEMFKLEMIISSIPTAGKDTDEIKGHPDLEYWAKRLWVKDSDDETKQEKLKETLGASSYDNLAKEWFGEYVNLRQELKSATERIDFNFMVELSKVFAKAKNNGELLAQMEGAHWESVLAAYHQDINQENP